jgi:N,N'-diacetyllegionaminate synthase|tara:strand:+ start:445 stop:1488 length:1044 start_codon:yes stop_codon:yes gene_type:complete
MNIDNPKHTFVIAEAGSNWKIGSLNDDISQAKQLILSATNAGADAIKFQTFKSKTVYAQDAGQIDYLSNKNTSSSINKLFDDLSMPYDMIPELSSFCNKHKIIFMSTAFSVEDAKHLDPYVKIHKVASYEINHIRLIEFLARTKKPILISTGASSYNEIDFAIKKIKENGNDKIALLQCTAKYPAPIDSLNLNVISTLKSKYGLPVGFSDHSLDPVVGPLLSIGFGATIVEKHFTMDKSLSGPDHMFALDPNELKLMIDSIRNADAAKGNSIKEVLNVELELQKFATRSIQATKNIFKGDILSEGENFDILRPGNRIRGLNARFLDLVNGKKATKDISIGDGILDYE